MGLDNGIIVRKTKIDEGIRSCFWYKYWKEENKDKIKEEEICYWRKCWNIRNKIFEIIGKHPDDEEYEYSLSLDNIVDIYYMLKDLNKKNWFDGGSSIWDWEEIKKSVKRNIKKLNKLIKRMKREPDLEVIFYDSY